MKLKCEPCNNGPAAKFQDAEYGKGMRVHTINKTKNKGRCTCCGKEKGI